MTFQERFKKALDYSDKNMADIGRALKLNNLGTLSGWKTGKVGMGRADYVLVAADVLEVSHRWLMLGEGQIHDRVSKKSDTDFLLEIVEFVSIQYKELNRELDNVAYIAIKLLFNKNKNTKKINNSDFFEFLSLTS
jgi:hypothetical protein